MMKPNTAALLDAVALPGSSRTLGSEKAVRRLNETADHIEIALQFDFPAAHLSADIERNIRAALAAAGEQRPPVLTQESRIAVHKVRPGVKTLSGVKNMIAVASGKGGVGKSTTTANLAAAMNALGARVGVLDADLYGPSQPAMLGVAGAKPEQRNGRFVPVRTAEGIQVMSMGFLVAHDQAVVWRGPMISQALQQLLFQTDWDDIDYLFIDLPPGTGDIQLTLAQKIPVTGAVVVTTPQDIALIDARKAVDMFAKVQIPIFGILENMSLHICTNCGHREAVFGGGGGAEMAQQLGVPLLGQLPLSLPVREAMDRGEAAKLQQNYPDIAAIYRDAAFQTALAAADKGRDYSGAFPNIVVE
uniref:iron-sulfur cluster carrier protein ApbC n=1 Tax=Neisseria leonii TaxID=2995413 RepID=UPI003F585D81